MPGQVKTSRAHRSGRIGHLTYSPKLLRSTPPTAVGGESVHLEVQEPPSEESAAHKASGKDHLQSQARERPMAMQKEQLANGGRARGRSGNRRQLRLLPPGAVPITLSKHIPDCATHAETASSEQGRRLCGGRVFVRSSPARVGNT